MPCLAELLLTNYQLEISLYVKLKDWMTNSVDPDATACYEPSHLALHCLQKNIIIAYGNKRVNSIWVHSISNSPWTKVDIDLITQYQGYINLYHSLGWSADDIGVCVWGGWVWGGGGAYSFARPASR